MQTNILTGLKPRPPAARMPRCGDDQTDCTWAQLADTARRAGSFLASRTMPRRPVAFYLEKSVSAFAAMLGTVYAGCCYSVLDTRQPAARTLQVLDTLTPAFLVTDDAHAAAAARAGVQVGKSSGLTICWPHPRTLPCWQPAAVRLWT